MRILLLIFAMICLWIGGFEAGKKRQKQENQPTLYLPEEFMCWVSDEPDKPDTVLIYQSPSDDALYIHQLKPRK